MLIFSSKISSFTSRADIYLLKLIFYSKGYAFPPRLCLYLQKLIFSSNSIFYFTELIFSSVSWNFTPRANTVFTFWSLSLISSAELYCTLRANTVLCPMYEPCYWGTRTRTIGMHMACRPKILFWDCEFASALSLWMLARWGVRPGAHTSLNGDNSTY